MVGNVRQGAIRASVGRGWRIVSRVMLILMGISVAIGVVEAGWRAALLLMEEPSLATLHQEQLKRGIVQPGEPYRELALGDRIQVSPVRGVVYEWKPGVRALDAQGNRHTINEAGFRGPLIEENKAPGVVRIVGIGDSVMYGNGVGDGEPYLAILGSMLRERVPGARWEVINTGVPGYNTRMEVETLRAKGLAYRPDLVILHFVANDVDLPPFALTPSDPSDVSRSFVLEFLWDSLAGRKARPLERVSKRERRGPGKEASVVPQEYVGSTGEEGVRAALTDLAALREEHGFELLVIGGGRNPVVVEACKRLGIDFFSLRDARMRFEEEHGGDKRRVRELLTVSPNDRHPSALGHRVIAEALFEELTSSGRIQALMQRSGGGNE